MPPDADADDDLLLAQESLGEARLLLENGFRRGATSASYYAMFHAARALLEAEARLPRTHKGLVATFREKVVQTGLLDQWHLEALERERKRREEVDYEAGPAPTEEEAEICVDEAERFVRDVERVLKRRERTR